MITDYEYRGKIIELLSVDYIINDYNYYDKYYLIFTLSYICLYVFTFITEIIINS